LVDCVAFEKVKVVGGQAALPGGGRDYRSIFLTHLMGVWHFGQGAEFGFEDDGERLHRQEDVIPSRFP